MFNRLKHIFCRFPGIFNEKTTSIEFEENSTQMHKECENQYNYENQC